jgi:hypothetical protein
MKALRRSSRHHTNRLIDALDEGRYAYSTVCLEMLHWFSEADIAAFVEDFMEGEEE